MSDTGPVEIWLVPSVGEWLAVIIFLLTVSACTGSISVESTAENKYGPEVIEGKDLYLQTVAEDPSKELVDLEAEVPNIRYATQDNFMQCRVQEPKVEGERRIDKRSTPVALSVGDIG